MPDKPRILIADDESLFRKRAYMILEGSFDVHEAASAQEARHRITDEYDAILLDIVFPDGNGIEI